MLLTLNPTIYLYFLTFEVAAYLSIHYNKRLEKAHFHFVYEDEVWNLAGAQSIRITNISTKQYRRAELWDSHRVRFGT